MLNTYFPWKRQPKVKNGWKPLTLKAPILGGFISISLSIIVILEILSRKSLKNSNGGGVAFASQDGGISSAVNFGYLYVPTILAVFYSMIWSWVDLDVKRLEPWFQLSTKDGASAEDSLLLQYPFDFLPFIPITALRRRHWAVFLAGVIMLLVFWLVTPLQSAIFTTGIVTRLTSIYVGTAAVLTSLPLQSTALNTNFMTSAYGTVWLGQKLPPFTTNNFAFLPFYPVSKSGDLAMSSSDGSWSTTVEAFSTNLTCYPADFSFLPNLEYRFSNGKGCTADVGLPDSGANFTINYIGYYDNAQSDWALQQSPNCSTYFASSFLAVWALTASRANNSVAHSNMTALFCETSYTSQSIYVTINSTTHDVNPGFSARETETSTNISTIFNTTNFEYLLTTGVPATAQSERGNLVDTLIVDQSSHTINYSINWPASNMVGFALGLNDSPLDSLHDPLLLRRFFERAHQTLFSAAFSTLTEFVNTSTPNTIREGLFEESQEAIILVRPVAVIIEATLGLIAIFACFLWIFAHSRPSLLPFDPSSIADIISLAPGTDESLDTMKDEGILTTLKLERILSNKNYYLFSSETGVTSIRSRPLNEKQHSKYKSRLQAFSKELNKPPLPIRPVELSTIFGVVFICTMVSALAGLLFLYFWSKQRGGITLPTTNTVIRSLLENYAPTILATLIEPVWTILNRLLCLLQPFEALRKCRAEPTRSVDARYTSLPPQLTFWRALKARHFLLAVVCLIAVSSNVLAVTLSALFNESPAIITVEIPSNHQYQSRFNSTSIFDPANLSGSSSDHFYIVLSNIASGTALPAWVDKNFFYLPFKLESHPTGQNKKGELQGFSGSTIGLGANTTCTQFQKSDGTDTVQFEVNNNGSSIQFSVSDLTQNGTRVTCVFPITNSNTNETTVQTNTFGNGTFALEVVDAMQPTSDDGGFCSAMFFMGWVRAASEPEPGNRNITSTFLGCTQKLLVAEFEVVVDQTGHVISSNRTSSFAQDTSQYFTPNATAEGQKIFFNSPIHSEIDLLQESTFLILPQSANTFRWHNDSFTTDWMNSLLKLLTNSTSLVDPEAEVPDANIVKPLVEGLYQQLFATLLMLNAPHMFSPAELPSDPRANAIFVETRIFLSPTMFAASISILSLHILVAILYYFYRPQRFLSIMPTSVASVLAFAAGSRAMEDFRTIDRGKIHEGKHLYGYGRFVGTDGKTHIGIERQRYVVPLKSKNPEARRRKWKLWSNKDEKQPKTWI